MSIATDLDDWTDALAGVTGIEATRDPAAVFPPCLFVGAPVATRVTIGGGVTLSVPVWLVGPAPGSKANLDVLLDLLPTFYAYAGPPPDAEMRAEMLTVDGGEFPSYAALFTLPIT